MNSDTSNNFKNEGLDLKIGSFSFIFLERRTELIITQLNVDDICQDCPCFLPIMNHTHTNNGSFQMITISCDHHDFCMGIRSRIEKEVYEKIRKEK